MSLLIKSGTLITAAETFSADILIEGEKIIALGKDLDAPGAQVLDAAGKMVTPGGIDPHVHLNLPMFGTVSSDDHYTGMKAAAFGGTTTVLDFIPQDFPSLQEAIDTWHAKADSKATVDYGFHMNITRLDGQEVADLPLMAAQGITTLKGFMAYNGRLRLQDGEILRLPRSG